MRGKARFRWVDGLYPGTRPSALPIVTLISLWWFDSPWGPCSWHCLARKLYADLVVWGDAKMGGLIAPSSVRRTGAAFAAQLGTMQSTAKFDAKTMGL